MTAYNISVIYTLLDIYYGTYTYVCNYYINVTRFAKRGLIHKHSFKIHFSLPFDSYISGQTAHVFNIAEG